MSEQKPVANAFRDVDTGAIKYLLASKKEDEEKLLAQFEDVCILTPKELADQLKAEVESHVNINKELANTVTKLEMELVTVLGKLKAEREKAITEEREACAQLCDRQAELQLQICSDESVINQAYRCANDIRNRKNISTNESKENEVKR